MISLRSQAWLPRVMTSAPAANNAFAISGASPNPCEAFSALTTARSIARSLRRPGNRAATVSRPVRPTTSPRNSILKIPPAADDAGFRRHGIEADVVRANRHGVHLLFGKSAAEAEAVRQRGHRSVVESAAVA